MKKILVIFLIEVALTVSTIHSLYASQNDCSECIPPIASAVVSDLHKDSAVCITVCNFTNRIITVEALAGEILASYELWSEADGIQLVSEDLYNKEISGAYYVPDLITILPNSKVDFMVKIKNLVKRDCAGNNKWLDKKWIGHHELNCRIYIKDSDKIYNIISNYSSIYIDGSWLAKDKS